MRTRVVASSLTVVVLLMLASPGREAGVVLEAAGFHPARSGRDHLRVYCTACGYPLRRTDESSSLGPFTSPDTANLIGRQLGAVQRDVRVQRAGDGNLLPRKPGQVGEVHLRFIPEANTIVAGIE